MRPPDPTLPRHAPAWRALLRFALPWLGLWLALSLSLGLHARPASAQARPDAAAPVVYVAQVQGTIDLGLAPYLQRVLAQAQAEQAAAVVLQINTFGGRVDAAVQIRDALLASPVRTIAFVDPRAISAGALIALAAHTLVMAGGGTIGAAAPVLAGQPGAAPLPAEEKTVSYVRKEFRATAESRGRPAQLAEAMVDADVAIAGVVDKGKLLTLTTAEALRLKLADHQAPTLAQAVQAAGIAGAELRPVGVNWAENLVRTLTHPVVSSLLVTVAMLGIILELRTPGFGVPGLLGVASLALVLWGHWLVALAGWEELLLIAAGVLLLAVEFLLLPGFGVAGALGVAALLGGLVMSMLGSGNTTQLVLAVTGRMLLSLALALAASLVLLRFMTRLPAGRRLILDTALSAGTGYASPPEADAHWLHRRGRTLTPLHPAGLAEFDGERVDVVSEGGLIDANQPVEVIRVDGNRIVVRPQAHHAPKE